ncbi:MAG TPA: hypothetical protein VFP61_13870 [Acidimicrobiales bacterium]|nr:hypothetical protein [Acidimicrobiales bacterium]
MARPTLFEHNRWLGDKRTFVVHDLDNPVDTCEIDDLLVSERFLTFGPDLLAEARNRGFRPHVCARGVDAAAEAAAAKG